MRPILSVKLLVLSATLFGFSVGMPLLVHADELSELKALIKKQQDVIQQLVDRVGALEKKPTASQEQNSDLSYHEVPLSGSASSGEHILDKQWFEKLDISGFGAGGYVWTGDDAERTNGGFLNFEATLFVEAEVWDDISFFTELQTIRLADEDSKRVRTGEVHVHFKNVLSSIEDDLLGIKVGRMDIPFGEEYLVQDSIDNPMITLSAAFPYGLDEGIVFYGDYGKLSWVASVMDGNDERGADDTSDKAASLKFYGNVTDNLYLSGSFMRNGKGGKSALEFAGSHLQPVGGGRTSVLGESASTEVDSYLYELDAKYLFGAKDHLLLTWGQVFIDDANSDFDRDLLYFTAEPLIYLTDKLYLVARYSGIGTFDDNEGYHLDGEPYAGGTDSFGEDAQSLMRAAFGLGYWLNPNTVFKLEYSRDDFSVIDASSISDSNENRDLVGAQVVVKF